MRPSRADDEVVGQHGGRLQDVRVGRVRKPYGTHQRRFGQGADGALRKICVPVRPDAEPGHGGSGLPAGSHAGVQLAQVPVGTRRISEANGNATDGGRRGHDDGCRGRRTSGRACIRSRYRRRCRRGGRCRRRRRSTAVGHQEDAVQAQLAADRSQPGGLRGTATVRTAQRTHHQPGRLQPPSVRHSVPSGRRHRPAQKRTHRAPTAVGRPDGDHRPTHGDHTVDHAGQTAYVRLLVHIPTVPLLPYTEIGGRLGLLKPPQANIYPDIKKKYKQFLITVKSHLLHFNFIIKINDQLKKKI